MKTLYVKDRREWRSWLEKNAGNLQEIFLIYYKKNSGNPRIAYDDAVEEALCFGWIDGRVNKLDDQRYVQRLTPRRPGSRWSTLNVARATKLVAEGKMKTAGLAVFNPARKTTAQPTQLPGDLEQSSKHMRMRGKSFSASSVLSAHDHRMGGKFEERRNQTQALPAVDRILGSESKNQVHVEPFEPTF